MVDELLVFQIHWLSFVKLRIGVSVCFGDGWAFGVTVDTCDFQQVQRLNAGDDELK